MKQKYLVLYFVALAAVFACTRFDESSLPVQNGPLEMVEMSFTATIEHPGDTKTSLEGSLDDAHMRTLWKPSDKLATIFKVYFEKKGKSARYGKLKTAPALLDALNTSSLLPLDNELQRFKKYNQ